MKRTVIRAARRIAGIFLACCAVWFSSFGAAAEYALNRTVIPAAVYENSRYSREVSVSTIDELINAIADNTLICLNGGSFNLAQAKDYGKERTGPCTWLEVEDGYGLQISGVSGLTILGGGASIGAEPIWADVLSFEGCNGLVLEGLTIGHAQRQADSWGCALRLTDCTNISLGDCRIDGSGFMGLNAIGCSGLSVDFCEFYCCAESAVNLYACEEVRFTRNWIHDFVPPALSIFECENVSWDGSLLPGEFCTTDMNLSGDTPLALLQGEDTDWVTEGSISYRFPSADEQFHMEFENWGGYDLTDVRWQVAFPEMNTCAEIRFRPNWLPFAVDTAAMADEDGYYSRLVSEGVATQMRPAPYRNMSQPFMIDVFYAPQLREGGLLLQFYIPGSIVFDTIGEWEALETCAFMESGSDGQYVILYSAQYGYVIVISGQCPMEDLITIAQNLEVDVTRNAIFSDDFVCHYATMDIAVG